ncbi:MAG: hypothetical protein M3540_12525 [Actinomycetota bacterium]|nr:hypothetical protein [Actinomycetota bacterium]
MTLTFISPLAALVGLLAVGALYALVRAERRSRALCDVLGLEPRRFALVPPVVAIALAAGLLALAAAQPVVATVSPVAGRTDAEVVFVFDISRSMLARPSAGEATRFDRARRSALALRGRFPDVPAGVASLTDRVLPHLFPSISDQAFSATVTRSLGIERPPPDRFGRGRATSLRALAALAERNFFAPSADRRLAIVFTDAESRPVDAIALRDSLQAGNVTVLFVRVWGPEERILGSPRRGDADYRPDPTSGRELSARAAERGAPVFDETRLDEITRSARAALGEGPTGPEGRDLQSRELAPYAALAAFVPLGFLFWRRR